MENATTTTRYDADERKQIALTILSQFAGGRNPGAFTQMVGAKDLVSLDGGIRFGLKPCCFNKSGINTVQVILTPADEYTVTFSKVRAGKETIIATHEHVYCDDLPGLFFKKTDLLPYFGF